MGEHKEVTKAFLHNEVTFAWVSKEEAWAQLMTVQQKIFEATKVLVDAEKALAVAELKKCLFNKESENDNDME